MTSVCNKKYSEKKFWTDNRGPFSIKNMVPYGTVPSWYFVDYPWTGESFKSKYVKVRTYWLGILTENDVEQAFFEKIHLPIVQYFTVHSSVS